MKLKYDSMGYKSNYLELEKEQFKYELMNEREKECLFHPDLNKSNFIFKNPKYDYYKNTSDYLNKSYTNATQIRKRNFNRLYARFMEEERLREEVLETMREIKNRREEKKCTLTPKIKKYRTKKYFIIKKLNKSFDLTPIYYNEKIPIYERLYSLRKIYNHKKIKTRNNKGSKEKYNSKSFNKNNKSYDETKNSPSNSKLKSRKIKFNEYDFKNKDINDSKKIDKNIIYEKKTQKVQKRYNNKAIKDDKKIVGDIYVIMNINLPKGGIKQLKIYKNIGGVKSLVNEFCKKYNIDDENKKIIYNEAISFKNNIYGKNVNEIKFTNENN